MNNRIEKLTYSDFLILLRAAQAEHAMLDEPIPDMGKENIEKIKACLAAPFLSFDSCDLYKGFRTKAAVLFYSMIKGHALMNGNKRMAIVSLGYFCFKNNRDTLFTDNELYTFSKRIAASKNPDNAKKLIIKKFFLRIYKSKTRTSITILVKRKVRFVRQAQKSPLKNPIFQSVSFNKFKRKIVS